MKLIEINLAGPFAEVLATLLALPRVGTNTDDLELPRIADSGLREKGACDAEVDEAFRLLYEAANGRQVETQIGFIAIAPPAAAFLKDKPYHVATQYEFFVEALTRVLAQGYRPGKHHLTNDGSRRGASVGTGRNKMAAFSHPHRQIKAFREKERIRSNTATRLSSPLPTMLNLAR